MKKNIKQIFRVVSRTYPYWYLIKYGDSLTASIANKITSKTTDSSPNKVTLIYTPAGDGNIGDHAMLNAHLSHISGDVVIITSGVDSPIEADLLDGKAQIIPLKSSYYYPPFLRIPSVVKFTKILNNVEKMYIHGADTMDGGNASASMARMSLLSIATKKGVKTAILGFSWSDHVPNVVKTAMLETSRNTKLCARDPEGYRRLVSLGVSNVTQVADMAFSRKSKDGIPDKYNQWILSNRDSGYIVLNTSGFIQKKFNQEQEFENIVSFAHANNLPIMFLPHVIRDVDSDLPVAENIFSKYGRSSDILVNELMTPSQVQSLVEASTLVITGRMHLSILSLLNARPVIALSTVGKVKGLFELFGISEYVVDPKPGYGRDVTNLMQKALLSRQHLVNSISSALPAVQELSLKNFSILDE